ncbi:DUF4374 domain-containing protein [Mucilaginibacter limnophilus]|uniref:DUF4374 domain-containing protein n=1 Tax=Mucilaginibacter limnophilus TaxID=1932778 RepID=A0A3S3TGB1_9SPHI|nr:DUF4374 domain-containing protein [Mucilaginibacter limnophilus]RVU00408.1 DUF4374 domain-containing protein [Mucilaginibacter limnophilus]
MKIKFTLAAAVVAVALASCAKKENSEAVPEDPGNFIVTVTPTASTGVADYLLTASSLDTGRISTAGNGVEQDGTYRYYVTHNNKFFSMLYGQGNPGAVTAYNIVDGKLNKLTNFQTETVQAFAPVNDDLLLFKISRNVATPNSLWYKVNTNSLLITSEGSTNTLELTGTGELAHFSWLKQVGDKVYAPYFSIIDRTFATNHPNNAWIAVFNYADMSLNKIITDDRTSFIGRYFTDGLAVTENNDVYAFSSSVAVKDGTFNSTKPSAITRIKAGTTEFDQSYFFNFEEATGGMNITNWLYVGNNTFIVNATTKTEKGAYTVGSNVGIVNVVDKTYKPVTGLPAKATIAGLTTNNYTPKDGKTAYVGVNLTDASSWVYKIDASTATATKGLKVEGGVITAIQHLD